MLVSDSDTYKNEFLEKLELTDEDLGKGTSSKQFNDILSKKLLLKKNCFSDLKLQKIQELARSISKEKVFDNLRKTLHEN